MEDNAIASNPDDICPGLKHLLRAGIRSEGSRNTQINEHSNYGHVNANTLLKMRCISELNIDRKRTLADITLYAVLTMITINIG